jgi:MFS transporter, SHS family, lactate transporter
MGGVWDLAAATALENLPVEVRGVASRILQQGYALDYLFAAIINLFLVPEVVVGYFGLGLAYHCSQWQSGPFFWRVKFS